jgi:hypothetical protein
LSLNAIRMARKMTTTFDIYKVGFHKVSTRYIRSVSIIPGSYE